MDQLCRLTEVAEPPVEPGLTQTRPVGPVAAAVVGTVTLLVALLSIEALWTACRGTHAQAHTAQTTGFNVHDISSLWGHDREEELQIITI